MVVSRRVHRVAWLLVPVLVVVAALLLQPVPRTAAATAANPNASADAKKVLNWLEGLRSRTSNKVVSGQHLSHDGSTASFGYRWYVEELAKPSYAGKYVALIGTGYTASNLSDANTTLKQHWNNGGLVTIEAHFANPFNGDDAWVNDTRAAKPDLRRLLRSAPSSTERTNWLAALDRVAAGLQELENAGVVVLWRPLHEMNGNWFWWGHDMTKPNNTQPYKDLWADMFNYFTYTKRLDNLLWVYSSAVSWDASVVHYYPGNGYVDIGGIDRYDDVLAPYSANDYTNLKNTGKPIGFTETGPLNTVNGTWDTRTIVNRIRASHPDMVFFLEWHSWTGNKIALAENWYAKELLNDGWVITRDEVNWR